MKTARSGGQKAIPSAKHELAWDGLCVWVTTTGCCIGALHAQGRRCA